MATTYADIGRRVVELYQQHLDREEFHEGLAAVSVGTFYEFAAKQKASGTGKKKNCTPGKSHFCKAGGEGTCIPMSKKCRQKLDDADSQAVDNYVKDKAGGGANKQEPQKTEASLDDLLGGDDDATLGDLLGDEPTSPGKTEKTKTESKANSTTSSTPLEKARDFMVSDENAWEGAKMSRMKEEFGAISDDESRAVATWLSNSSIDETAKYALMNRAIYAPGSVDESLLEGVKATNALAVSGLQKMQPITPDYIQSQAKAKGENYDPDAPLQRHMKIDDPESFIARYANAAGKEISEDTFFATTHLDKLDWIENESNITYRVKPKLDGTGQGRYIDHYKNSASEGEVMFIPGTKFRVSRVERPPSDIPPKPKKPRLLDDDDDLTADNHLVKKLMAMRSYHVDSSLPDDPERTKKWKAEFTKNYGNFPGAKELLAKVDHLTDDDFRKFGKSSNSFDNDVKKWTNLYGDKVRYVIELEEI